jgi:hypothetical protein
MGATYHPTVEERGDIAMKVAGLFGEASGRPLSEISLDTPYEALGIGRKGLEFIMIRTQWEYDFIIPEETLQDLRTVRQFANYTEANRGQSDGVFIRPRQ